jgi:predicted DNA-binding protein with PD1-like motif
LIILESKEGRRLAGRIFGGADAVQSLRDMCRNHRIRTGSVRGIGRLASHRLAQWDGSDWSEDDTDQGPVQLVSMSGNISKGSGEETWSIHLNGIVASADGSIRGGRIVEATVDDLEFFVYTLDDFSFVRSEDEKGLGEWLQIDSGEHVKDHGASHRSEFLPGRLGARHNEQDEYELMEGDLLNHPKFGLCTVIAEADDERATVRLDNGRTLELHLGLLEIRRTGVEDSGRQTFRLRIRRR